MLSEDNSESFLPVVFVRVHAAKAFVMLGKPQGGRTAFSLNHRKARSHDRLNSSKDSFWLV